MGPSEAHLQRQRRQARIAELGRKLDNLGARIGRTVRRQGTRSKRAYELYRESVILQAELNVLEEAERQEK